MLLKPFKPSEVKAVKEGRTLVDFYRQKLIEEAFQELNSTDVKKVATYINKNKICDDVATAAKAFQNKEFIIEDFCLLNSKGKELLYEKEVFSLWDDFWETLLYQGRKVELSATFEQPNEELLKMAIDYGYNKDYPYYDDNNSNNNDIIDYIFDNRLDELVNDYMFPDLDIEFYSIKKESLGGHDSSNPFDTSPYLLNARAKFTFNELGVKVKHQNDIYSGSASGASFRAKFIK